MFGPAQSKAPRPRRRHNAQSEDCEDKGARPFLERQRTSPVYISFSRLRCGERHSPCPEGAGSSPGVDGAVAQAASTASTLLCRAATAFTAPPRRLVATSHLSLSPIVLRGMRAWRSYAPEPHWERGARATAPVVIAKTSGGVLQPLKRTRAPSATTSLRQPCAQDGGGGTAFNPPHSSQAAQIRRHQERTPGESRRGAKMAHGLAGCAAATE